VDVISNNSEIFSIMLSIIPGYIYDINPDKTGPFNSFN